MIGAEAERERGVSRPEEQRVCAGSMIPETVSMHIMSDLMCYWIMRKLLEKLKEQRQVAKLKVKAMYLIGSFLVCTV